MTSHVTIIFHRMSRSAAQEQTASALAYRMRSGNENIQQCRITLERVATDLAHDIRYLVKIELSLPGSRIHADSLEAQGSGHVSIESAMEAAGSSAMRQLQKWQRRSAPENSQGILILDDVSASRSS